MGAEQKTKEVKRKVRTVWSKVATEADRASMRTSKVRVAGQNLS